MIEESRTKLINLIDIKGISSEKVIKVSVELDDMIDKYYFEFFKSQLLYIRF